MKKILTYTKYISLFALIFLLTISFSPQPLLAERSVVGYEYTKVIGGIAAEFLSSTAIDSLDNVYFTGNFLDTLDFDPSEAIDEHTSVGSDDIFITKINADGSYGYTKTIGDVGGDYVAGIATDSLNNVYITGSFSGTIDFDPSGSVDNHTSAGSNDIFLTKINADGSYGYTKTMGASGLDYGVSVKSDSLNNIYLTGSFSSTVDFDPSGAVDNLTSAGGTDIFLTKINADGSYGYTKKFGGAGANDVVNVLTDSLNNVYITSTFSGTIDFDPSGAVDNHTSAGNNDIFLTKINADGSYGYTKTVGAGGLDYGVSVKSDSLNNIYLTGSFSSTVDFDPSGAVDNLTSAGGTDIFLTKINADGSYGYTKKFGGAGANDVVNVLADSLNNVYITSIFSNTIDFDPSGAVDNHTSSGDTDIFLTKINADGSYGYTKTMGGVFGDSIFSSIIDSLNNIYLTGIFSGTADFDPSEGIDEHTTDSTGLFLTKINSNGSYGYTNTINVNGGNYPISIATDSLNNVYTSGYLSETVDFDPSEGIDEHTSTGSIDIFLTKTNSDGSYAFTKTMGGVGNFSRVVSVAVDSGNNIYVTGYFLDTTDFDPSDAVDDYTSAGDTDIFLTKLSQTTVYDLTYTAGANGTLTGTTSQQVNEGDDATAITAVANAGYEFLNWSDASTINPRTDTNVITDMTITANFTVQVSHTSSGSRPKNINLTPNVFQTTPVVAPTITPPTTNFTFYKTLRLKTLSEEVKELQKYLNTHGFILATTGAGSVNNETIVFGRLTHAAVVKFQLANGLAPDGIVGPLTRGVINSSN